MIEAAILSMVLAPDAAWAEKRVALIVGNSTYQTVPQLPNPSRDATAVGQMFKDAGFNSVDVQLDLGNVEFKRAIRRFEATSDQADIAVVYYAGHGLEIGGANFLVPVDARLASDRDAPDEAIALERLVSSADGAKRLRLIILDACRDNPFATTLRKERSNRGIVAGLGKVEPTSTDTLIAYAAKAGSTAEDGDGQHSPFTLALLKALPVPGLDVRLAFGRVRDDVMKMTGNRQEPYVYGSLGGGSVALVPAPAVPQEAPVSEVKADFELVQKIGTQRAWEVFLGTHPVGFYADLARAQIEKLQPQPQPAPQNDKVTSLPSTPAPSSSDPPSKAALEWDKVKDSTDPEALQKFVKRFADSPFAVNARQRIDILKNALREREDKARAEREAAAKATEQARIQAEQEKAELAAAKKRAEDERRAKAAEAEQQAKAAEAERKATEVKQKADAAEKAKADAEAAALRAASEKQAKEAEEQRKKADLVSAQEAACKNEQSKLDELIGKGSEGSGVDDLKTFSKTVTCERLKPLVVAKLEIFGAEAAKRAAALPNSPELIRSVQTQLIRLGCLTGEVDGTLNPSTKSALGRYMSIEGQPSENVSVTEALTAELIKHKTRVCPLECKTGETKQEDTCVATEKPAAPATSSHEQSDREREQRRAKSAPEPSRPRQQALARPSVVHGGGGHSMIGVGF